MKLETWHAPPGEEIPNHPSFPVLIHATAAPGQDPVGGEGVSHWR